MSENSKYNDKKLFEFYLEHGYFPEDFKIKPEKTKKDINNQNKKLSFKNNNSKNNDYKKNNYSEEDEKMFLNALKNLDCANHIKNTYEDKREKKSRFKPNLKNVKPQDTLDLHGLTRERALHSVKKFIFESKKNNLKTVLIIHGKGFRSENNIAVLKDLVEYYIATEGRHYIKYSAEAPARLGGSGAKLIYLYGKD